MPESMLLIEQRAEEEFSELRRKFHPHHDYLNLIIPSMWFVFGVCLHDFYFYGADHIRRVLSSVTNLRPQFASASTSLEFFLSLALFMVGLTVIYVIGQMINGLSALLLDRLIVKKLLKYPFELYQARSERPPEIDDSTLFREVVLHSSYGVFCLNLIPFIFLELVVTVFAWRVPSFTTWIQHSPWFSIVAIPILLYVHFGKPSRRKALRQPHDDDPKYAAHCAELVVYHWVMLVILAFLEFGLIVFLGWVVAILLLPAINFIVGYAERRVMKDWVYSKPYARHLYNYARACFTNPIYLAAKLVGYGDPPGRRLILNVREKIGDAYQQSDFFWISYLIVQNHGAGASQTTYHFLAQYSMARNVCNATAFVLLASVGAFWLRWPTNHELEVVWWALGLCCLMYALFARYLYLYGSYFSKYVLRTAAYIFATTKEQVAKYEVGLRIDAGR